ncbi:TPA: hypothetical protein N0F65_001051 [Lagenidium giganteum]|uniref:PH domain-containing protein n=1 Tax=Lagenidium giganteum TaxID=4803 RepID=A0AAV2YPX7_9STRA|nr:TPA: hypothetical protein N0F65_001051 [Lagenidium giganteum]
MIMKAKNHSAMTPTIDNTKIAFHDCAAEPIALDGYLRKQGLRVKSWKRRYFNGFLTYKKDARPETKILKRDAVENVLYWSGAKHGFAVHLSSGRILYITAATEEEASVWYTALNRYLTIQQLGKDMRRLTARPLLDPIWEAACEC